MADLVKLVEKASDKAEGSTKAQAFNNPLVLLDEFLTGTTVDKNLLNLVLDSKDEAPLSGDDFWQASGLAPQHEVREFFAKAKIEHESLALPSKGDYKLPHLNF